MWVFFVDSLVRAGTRAFRSSCHNKTSNHRPCISVSVCSIGVLTCRRTTRESFMIQNIQSLSLSRLKTSAPLWSTPPQLTKCLFCLTATLPRDPSDLGFAPSWLFDDLCYHPFEILITTLHITLSHVDQPIAAIPNYLSCFFIWTQLFP